MSAELDLATPTLQVRDQWNALLQMASTEVFEIMLNSRLDPSSVNESVVASEFTAMVGFAGNLRGVLSLRCTAATASLIASKMLGLAPGEAEEESWDAIGEVSNMIAGAFKAKLPGGGSQCMLSVPTIITGADYHLHNLADGGSLEVAMEFEGETIWITLEIHS